MTAFNDIQVFDNSFPIQQISQKFAIHSLYYSSLLLHIFQIQLLLANFESEVPPRKVD